MLANSNTALPTGWVYSPAIDLELKQYTLLAYLQRVKARFAERKLYPHLEHVHAQVNELLHLQRAKQLLARSLNGTLLGFDPATGDAIRERPQESELLRVIDDVIEFAVPGLMDVHREGRGLLEEFAQQLCFHPVGLEPLHLAEGWLFLRSGRETRVYGYTIPFVVETSAELPHRNVFTRYVTSYSASTMCTYEHMKADLIERYPQLPNPATFVVETEIPLPCLETFVPLAKRFVQAHISGRGQ